MMMKNFCFGRVGFVFFLPLALFLLSSNGMGQDPADGGELKQVRLQLKWKHQFQFAGYYAALEKGYYADAGFEVEIMEAQEGEDPTDSVLSGEADYGVGTSELVVHRAKGEPVVLLAPIFQHSPLVLLVTKDSGIGSIHELAGRKAAIEPQAAELWAYMTHEGVPTGTLQRSDHSFGPEPLIAGEIDVMSAYSTDEPFLLEQVGKEYLVFNPRAGGIDFYGDSLFTRESIAKKYPEEVRVFLEASLKGWKYACANPDEMVELIFTKYSQRHSREHLKYEAQKTMRLILPDLVEVGYTNKGRWRFIAETYVELGMLKEEPTLDGFFFDRVPKRDMRRIYLIVGSLLVVLVMVVGTSLRYYRMNQSLGHTMVEREQAEKGLRAAEERSRVLVEEAPFPISITDIYLRKSLFLNPWAASSLAGNREDILAMPVESFFVVPADRERILDMIRTIGRVDDIELSLRRVDGTEFWARVNVSLIEFDHQPALFSTFMDITRRKIAEESMKQSHRDLTAVTDSVPVLIVRVNKDYSCIFANSTFAHWLEVDKDVLIGKPFADFLEEKEGRRFVDLAKKVFAGEHIQTEGDLPTPKGLRTLQVQMVPHFEQGQIASIFIVATDITEQKKQQEQLRELAATDELTGLLNRRECFAIASHEFLQSQRYLRPLSVAMIDIDFFKKVNDEYGHAVGDQALRQMAALLNGFIRESDILGRIGGEEFLVLMPQAKLEAAVEVADRLRKAASGLVIINKKRKIQMTISIGVASLFPTMRSFDELLFKSDEALYRAKKNGRNRVEI